MGREDTEIGGREEVEGAELIGREDLEIGGREDMLSWMTLPGKSGNSLLDCVAVVDSLAEVLVDGVALGFVSTGICVDGARLSGTLMLR